MISEQPFNPLDYRNLGASVAEALIESDATQMSALSSFDGAGLYAIYYDGSFPPYARVADRNKNGRFEWPVYVGKAIPKGARQGGRGKAGTALFSRLREHARTVELAQNLNLDDFWFRVLVVDDIWIPLGESLLISKLTPIWNTILDGFGNHTPGKGRFNGMRPKWDQLHPGRKWADLCQPRPETPEQIASEITNFLDTHSADTELFER